MHTKAAHEKYGNYCIEVDISSIGGNYLSLFWSHEYSSEKDAFSGACHKLANLYHRSSIGIIMVLMLALVVLTAPPHESCFGYSNLSMRQLR